MKTMVMFFILMISLFGCNKGGKDSAIGDPPSASLAFTFTDENGQDLFSGENAKYDPNDIRVVLPCIKEIHIDCEEEFIKIPLDSTHNYLEAREFSFRTIDDGTSVFLLEIGYVMNSTFLFEFFPEKIDTMYFRLNYLEEIKESFIDDGIAADNLPIPHFDAFYNGELICIDCNRVEIYKIVVK